MCTEEEVLEEAEIDQQRIRRLVGTPILKLTGRDRRCSPGITEHELEAVITGKIVQIVTESRQNEDLFARDELLSIIKDRGTYTNSDLLLKAILDDVDAVFIVLLEEKKRF
jgi:hypothetical protein